MVEMVEKFKRRKILKYLTSVSPQKLVKISEKKIIPAFKKLAAISPAYQQILANHDVDIRAINTIDQFQQSVPVLNKHNFFTKYTAGEMLGKNLDSVKLTMTSSGFSNTFSYGFLSEKVLKKSRLGVDATFDYMFNISDRKSYFINCFPMGLHVNTSLTMAEVSVRSDMAIALLKKIAPYYDQTIIVGDPHFIKKLAEEGIEQGLKWGELNINVIIGQDWLPESLRTYLANIFEIDLEQNNQRGIFATMGMTEMGLNVFHESYHTMNIRRALMKDSKLSSLLSQKEEKAPPYIFHYYPTRTFIEQNPASNKHELLFTSLNNDDILPMIRYTTGDSGSTLSYAELSNILSKSYPNLIPDLKLPIGIISGRINTNKIQESYEIKPEAVKEGLYRNFDNVPKITGLISISYQKDIPEINIHLNKGVSGNKKLENSLHENIAGFVQTNFKVNLVKYDDFPSALSLDYENKLAVR